MDTRSIQKSYRFRAEPTPAQAEALQRWMGAARWVWNWSLGWRTKGYRRRGERRTGVDASREITRLKRLPGFAWLKTVPSTVLTQKLRDQDAAFQAFFAGRSKYPRFASRRRRPVRSLRFQLDQRHVHRTFLAGERLILPGLGPVKLRWSQVPGGTPKMVTIRHRPDGHWEVSFMVEEGAPAASVGRHEIVGVDVGLKDLVVTDRGERFGNPQPLRRTQRRLKRAQRALTRKQGARKGETPSHRYRRQQRRVAKLHQRVRDTRSDALHKITSTLVRENQAICIEDLNVRGLCRGRLAKAFGDAGVGELRRQLTYKAGWHGRTIRTADRFAPTSQCCSTCGYQHRDLKLHHRHWACPVCGSEHDRDVNAAANIITFATGGSPGSGWACAQPRHVEGETSEPVAVNAASARRPVKRVSITTHSAA